MRVFSHILFAAALLAGCAADQHSWFYTTGRSDGSAVTTETPVGRWELASFAGGDSPGAAEITFEVESQGRITGSAGCNRYVGQWSLGSGKTTLGAFAATRRMCAREIMEVEQRFLTSLARAGGRRSADGGMVLTDAAGGDLLSFRAAK